MIDDLIFVEQLLRKANVKDRNKIAVISYFFEGKTFAEVGNDFGVTATTARQIIMKCLRRMRLRNDCGPLERTNAVSELHFSETEPRPKPKRIEEPISEEEYYRLLKLEGI